MISPKKVKQAMIRWRGEDGQLCKGRVFFMT